MNNEEILKLALAKSPTIAEAKESKKSSVSQLMIQIFMWTVTNWIFLLVSLSNGHAKIQPPKKMGVKYCQKN